MADVTTPVDLTALRAEHHVVIGDEMGDYPWCVVCGMPPFEEAKRLHVKYELVSIRLITAQSVHVCRECWTPWPCLTARLIAELAPEDDDG